MSYEEILKNAEKCGNVIKCEKSWTYFNRVVTTKEVILKLLLKR